MSASLQCDLPDLAATARLAASVSDHAAAGDAILLQGPLGAGKSAFARAFLRHAAGDPDLEVPSPTFTLVQSYDLPRFRAHHFDLWRLKGPADLAELGWDEALGDVVLVEWPDRLGRLWPDGALLVTLSPAGEAEELRRAELRGWPERRSSLLACRGIEA